MTEIDRLGAAQACLRDGTPPLLMICSSSGDALSASARELVRAVRREGVRVEFHTPGDPEALLQAVNRLLADVPFDRSLTHAGSAPPHILVVDEGETLAESETASLRRMVQGLRGSCFRVVVLVRRLPAAMKGLPVAEIVDLAMVWDVDDRAAGSDAADAFPILVPTAEEPLVASPDTPIPDVLAELARERAESRGFDVTLPSRWSMSPVKVVMALIVFLTTGIAVEMHMAEDATTGPAVYDCGLHADREAIDVLLARIDRTLPTRIVAESGRLRLQVGPFESRSAADSARAQVWRLGACRVVPDRTAGG